MAMSLAQPSGMERRRTSARMPCGSKPTLPNPQRYFIGHGELLPRVCLELAGKSVGVHLQRDAIVTAARQESSDIQLRESRNSKLEVLLDVDEFMEQEPIRKLLVGYDDITEPNRGDFREVRRFEMPMPTSVRRNGGLLSRMPSSTKSRAASHRLPLANRPLGLVLTQENTQQMGRQRIAPIDEVGRIERDEFDFGGYAGRARNDSAREKKRPVTAAPMHPIMDFSFITLPHWASSHTRAPRPER